MKPNKKGEKMKATQIAGMSNNRVLNDLYRTPAWATEALMEREKFSGDVLEPACGLNDMVEVIQKYNNCVARDLVSGQDFMRCSDIFPNVITNPPYKNALQFVLKAKQVATKKIALLCKLVFLESISRYEMFLDKEFPLKKIMVFCKRVNFMSDKDPKGEKSSTMAIAWFVWDRDYGGKPYIEWIN